jgi:hypothetical protein
MGNFHLRHIVREVLKEYYQNTLVYNYGINKFPYLDQSRPEEQNLESVYFDSWNQLSSNQDLQQFPQEEFNLGLKIEKERNPVFNVLELAQRVIENLKQDSKFYSKLNK